LVVLKKKRKKKQLILEFIHSRSLHDQSKSAFLEGQLFSNQSGLFENFSDCSDWLDKSRPSKKPLLF